MSSASRSFGDELFSLTANDLSCYTYGMRNCHDLPLSLPLVIRFPVPARARKKGLGVRLLGHHSQTKTNFDGTKLPMVVLHPKTTTYGMNCSFRLDSITQNRAQRSVA